MLSTNSSRGPSYHGSASSIYSKTESSATEAGRQSAHAAAAAAFTRAQERRDSRLLQRGTDHSRQNELCLHRHADSISNANHALKRRQSVRFVNPTLDNHRAISNTSVHILTEPRPGFATHRPSAAASNIPTDYRPISPFSNVSKASMDIRGSHVSALSTCNKVPIIEDDTSASLHIGVRKSKSMFMPLKAPDVFYTSGTPETSPKPCFSYGNGISNIPMQHTQPRQASLKTHRSMNFLGLKRGQSSFATGRSNDLDVQVARDRFLHQTNQQRLLNKPSFLFRAKVEKQGKSLHIGSRSSDRVPFSSLDEGMTLSKEYKLKHTARRAATSIKKRLRRVFGRSSGVSTEISKQQIIASETHVREYSGTDVRVSSTDSGAQNPLSDSDIRSSFNSHKKSTIRLVPPSPRRLPIYTPQSHNGNVSSNAGSPESTRSRNTSNRTPESTKSVQPLPRYDENKYKMRNVTISEKVAHLPAMLEGRIQRTSNLGSPIEQPRRIHSGAGDTETDDDSSNHAARFAAAYTDILPHGKEYVDVGHVRESAQINDDDTAVAQAGLKWPLGEFQNNIKLSTERMPALRPSMKNKLMVPNTENIDSSRPRPPLPPTLPSRTLIPPRRLSFSAPEPAGCRSSPESQPLGMDENGMPPSAPTHIVMLGRDWESPSPAVSESQSPPSGRPSPTPDAYLSCGGTGRKSSADTPSHTCERLWKIEPVQRPWSTNGTLRKILVDRGNRRSGIDPVETPTSLDGAVAGNSNEVRKPIPADGARNERENMEPRAADKGRGAYETANVGAVGSSIMSSCGGLVNSHLSWRRSRITGTSEGGSEKAFI